MAEPVSTPSAPSTPSTPSSPAAPAAPAAPDAAKPAVPGAPAGGGTEKTTGGEKANSIEKPKGAGDGTTPGTGKAPDLTGPIFMIVAFVALMYFMIIRPQRKREKSRQAMLGKLKVGDRVLTAGGVIGEIAEMTNDEVTLKIDARKDVRLRMRRWAIAGPADEAASEQTVKEQSGN